ncbi:CheC, inhibitor of MCP methylation [Methanosalsum zhilinae DSM 4017]|uniref:CheC, inhibitor of MCP methylation n=1 Tax=Methanosalsum zhilinae (strain DSM 4017 / NBRC 107636 / OCM 62 / WeN5) TaxID=679901 RepID=F7XQE8_METZD|nr:chemotaxis protein CheC [Methanosalsum zhilinae]AEH60449.1 CheC, inhibitor of MCP methylation [Methanosalsum zhilinae DSM 4017]
MSETSQENLQDSFYIDALKEIAGIGMGNATTSLSLLVDKRVQLNLANAYALNTDQMVNSIPDSVTMVGIVSKLEGDVQGCSVIFMELNNAIVLSELLLDDIPDADVELSESSLTEAGSILTGSYFNSFSQFLGLSVRHSSPFTVSGTIGEIFEALSNQFSHSAEISLIDGKTMILETMFMVNSTGYQKGLNTLYCDMFIFLDPESVSVITRSIDHMLKN